MGLPLKNKIYRQCQQHEPDDMVGFYLCVKSHVREGHKNYERDDLLQHFELYQ